MARDGLTTLSIRLTTLVVGLAWAAAPTVAMGQVGNPLRDYSSITPVIVSDRIAKSPRELGVNSGFESRPVAPSRLTKFKSELSLEEPAPFWPQGEIPLAARWAQQQPSDKYPVRPATALDSGPELVLPHDAPQAMSPTPDLEPQHWPDEDCDCDPGIPRGPIRTKFAQLSRAFRLWTGVGVDQSERYVGLGDPLTNTSWLNRPWSFGAFAGTQMHDDPIQGLLGQSNSMVGGMRLGIDFDYYWGLELRYAYSNPDTFIPNTPVDIGSSHNYYVDLALMYYPWGDSRWRPYFSAGIGAATYRFTGAGASVSDSGVHLPLGIGLKYFYTPWLTLRFDAQYAPILGTNNLDFQNEFMLGLGAEVRFGGRRQSYFPWTGNTAYW